MSACKSMWAYVYLYDFVLWEIFYVWFVCVGVNFCLIECESEYVNKCKCIYTRVWVSVSGLC